MSSSSLRQRRANATVVANTPDRRSYGTSGGSARRSGDEAAMDDDDDDDDFHNAIPREFEEQMLASSRQSSTTSVLFGLVVFLVVSVVVTSAALRSGGGGDEGILVTTNLPRRTTTASEEEKSLSKMTTTTRAATRNLKILTSYPRSVSYLIHEVEGRTDVLVTPDNEDAIRAVRTTIGMANNLSGASLRGKRKRRPWGFKSFLLWISNILAGSLRGGMEGSGDTVVPGDILLETNDVYAMRLYLAENGRRCCPSDDCGSGGENGGRTTASLESENNNNPVLQHYDDLLSRVRSPGVHSGSGSASDTGADAVWDEAVETWMWCKLSNGDGRGFVAHGTVINTAEYMTTGKTQQQRQRWSVEKSKSESSLNIPQMVEDARVHGIGIAVGRCSSSSTNETVGADADDSRLPPSAEEDVRPYPLIVLPADGDGTVSASAVKLCRKALQSLVTKTGIKTVDFGKFLARSIRMDNGQFARRSNNKGEGSANRMMPSQWALLGTAYDTNISLRGGEPCGSRETDG